MTDHFLKIIACFGAMLSVTNAVSVPFITKCKMDDSNCILRSTSETIPFFTAGIPEVGVNSLDPMYIENIDASVANLQIILKDINIKGLKNCVPKKVEFQDIGTTPGKLYIKTECSLDFSGIYEMKGVLIVPIEGKGHVNTSLTTVSTVNCNLSSKSGKDQKVYSVIKSCTTAFEYKPNSKVNFDNLFPDNEVMAKAAQEVIDSNPDVVVTQLAPPVVDVVMNVIIKNIKKMLERIPLEDLVL